MRSAGATIDRALRRGDDVSETIGLTPFADKPAPDLSGLTCEVIDAGEFPIQMTAKAIEMVRSALDETNGEEGQYLRVGVKGGGCSGFQYSLNFTDEVDEDDVLAVVDGVKVVTDNFSASYLKGTELDYVETLQGSGFKFNNPNAKRTCGCGSSFSA
jgi:iron-sulfur cluster assembly accessory protein